MNNNREVNKYVEAVIAVAENTGQLSELSQHLLVLLHVYKTSPDLRLLLQSKRIPQSTKSKVLSVVLSEILSELEFELLLQLLEDGQVSLLESVIKRIQYLVTAKSGSLMVTVSTTFPLANDELADLASEVENKLKKKIDMESVVDPEILGGATFRIGNTIIDGSIATRLQKLGDSLNQ